MARHREGDIVAVTKLNNKSTFLANAQLVWFPEPQAPFPFKQDLEFNLTNRMSFARMRHKFRGKIFENPPALTGTSIVHKNQQLLVYCELRPKQDLQKNIRKTAEFLRLQEWVGVVHLTTNVNVYMIPTSSLSHDLGLTVDSYPPMLHALFVSPSKLRAVAISAPVVAKDMEENCGEPNMEGTLGQSDDAKASRKRVVMVKKEEEEEQPAAKQKEIDKDILSLWVPSAERANDSKELNEYCVLIESTNQDPIVETDSSVFVMEDGLLINSNSEIEPVEVVCDVNGDPMPDPLNLDSCAGHIHVVDRPPEREAESEMTDLMPGSKKVSLEEYKRRRRVTVDTTTDDNEQDERDTPSPCGLVICDEGQEPSVPAASSVDDTFPTDDKMEADTFPTDDKMEADTSPDDKMEADTFPPDDKMEGDTFPLDDKMEADTFPPDDKMEADTFPPDDKMEADTFPPDDKMEADTFSPDDKMEADLGEEIASIVNPTIAQDQDRQSVKKEELVKKEEPVFAEDVMQTTRNIPNTAHCSVSSTGVPELKHLAYRACHDVMKRPLSERDQHRASSSARESMASDGKTSSEPKESKQDDEKKLTERTVLRPEVEVASSEHKPVVSVSPLTLPAQSTRSVSPPPPVPPPVPPPALPQATPSSLPPHLPPPSAQFLSHASLYPTMGVPPHAVATPPGHLPPSAHIGPSYPYPAEISPGPAYPPPYVTPSIPNQWRPPHVRQPMRPEEFREIATILQQGHILQQSLGFRRSTTRSPSRSLSCSRSRSRSCSHSRSRSLSRSYSCSISRSCSLSPSPSQSPRKSRSYSHSNSRSHSPSFSPHRHSRRSKRYSPSPSLKGDTVDKGTQVEVSTHKRGTQCKLPKTHCFSSQTVIRVRNEHSQTPSLTTKGKGIQVELRPDFESKWSQTYINTDTVGVQTEVDCHPAVSNLLSKIDHRKFCAADQEKRVLYGWLERKINMAENPADETMGKLSPLSGCSHISEGNWSDDSRSSPPKSVDHGNDSFGSEGGGGGEGGAADGGQRMGGDGTKGDEGGGQKSGGAEAQSDKEEGQRQGRAEGNKGKGHKRKRSGTDSDGGERKKIRGGGAERDKKERQNTKEGRDKYDEEGQKKKGGGNDCDNEEEYKTKGGGAKCDMEGYGTKGSRKNCDEEEQETIESGDKSDKEEEHKTKGGGAKCDMEEGQETKSGGTNCDKEEELKKKGEAKYKQGVEQKIKGAGAKGDTEEIGKKEDKEKVTMKDSVVNQQPLSSQGTMNDLQSIDNPETDKGLTEIQPLTNEKERGVVEEKQTVECDTGDVSVENKHDKLYRTPSPIGNEMINEMPVHVHVVETRSPVSVAGIPGRIDQLEPEASMREEPPVEEGVCLKDDERIPLICSPVSPPTSVPLNHQALEEGELPPSPICSLSISNEGKWMILTANGQVPEDELVFGKGECVKQFKNLKLSRSKSLSPFPLIPTSCPSPLHPSTTRSSLSASPPTCQRLSSVHGLRPMTRKRPLTAPEILAKVTAKKQCREMMEREKKKMLEEQRRKELLEQQDKEKIVEEQQRQELLEQQERKKMLEEQQKKELLELQKKKNKDVVANSNNNCSRCVDLTQLRSRVLQHIKNRKEKVTISPPSPLPPPPPPVESLPPPPPAPPNESPSDDHGDDTVSPPPKKQKIPSPPPPDKKETPLVEYSSVDCSSLATPPVVESSVSNSKNGLIVEETYHHGDHSSPTIPLQKGKSSPNGNGNTAAPADYKGIPPAPVSPSPGSDESVFSSVSVKVPPISCHDNSLVTPSTGKERVSPPPLSITQPAPLPVIDPRTTSLTSSDTFDKKGIPLPPHPVLSSNNRIPPPPPPLLPPPPPPHIHGAGTSSFLPFSLSLAPSLPSQVTLNPTMCGSPTLVPFFTPQCQSGSALPETVPLVSATRMPEHYKSVPPSFADINSIPYNQMLSPVPLICPSANGLHPPITPLLSASVTPKMAMSTTNSQFLFSNSSNAAMYPNQSHPLAAPSFSTDSSHKQYIANSCLGLQDEASQLFRSPALDAPPKPLFQPTCEVTTPTSLLFPPLLPHRVGSVTNESVVSPQGGMGLQEDREPAATAVQTCTISESISKNREFLPDTDSNLGELDSPAIITEKSTEECLISNHESILGHLVTTNSCSSELKADADISVMPSPQTGSKSTPAGVSLKLSTNSSQNSCIVSVESKTEVNSKHNASPNSEVRHEQKTTFCIIPEVCAAPVAQPPNQQSNSNTTPSINPISSPKGIGLQPTLETSPKPCSGTSPKGVGLQPTLENSPKPCSGTSPKRVGLQPTLETSPKPCSRTSPKGVGLQPTLETSPKPCSRTSPRSSPKAVSKLTSKPATKTVSKLISKPVPKTMSKSVSKSSPKAVSKTISKSNPKLLSKVVGSLNMSHELSSSMLSPIPADHQTTEHSISCETGTSGSVCDDEHASSQFYLSSPSCCSPVPESSDHEDSFSSHSEVAFNMLHYSGDEMELDTSIDEVDNEEMEPLLPQYFLLSGQLTPSSRNKNDLSSKDVVTDETSCDPKRLEKIKSLIVVQARVRGHLARKRFLELKKAALLFQARYQYLKQHRRRVKAAVIIQKVWRGYGTRKHFKKQKHSHKIIHKTIQRISTALADNRKDDCTEDTRHNESKEDTPPLSGASCVSNLGKRRARSITPEEEVKRPPVNHYHYSHSSGGSSFTMDLPQEQFRRNFTNPYDNRRTSGRRDALISPLCQQRFIDPQISWLVGRHNQRGGAGGVSYYSHPNLFADYRHRSLPHPHHYGIHQPHFPFVYHDYLSPQNHGFFPFIPPRY